MEKTILLLTDFVGSGDVAMATARTVLTRMGHRVLCLPTALISHTWNLGTPAQLDTTEYLKQTLSLWEGRSPDGVLLGYVASDEQAAFLAQQCERWQQEGVTIFLDPIFADNGALYRGITRERVELMKGLLPLADFVLPNQTEAGFLTGQTEPMAALAQLRELGAGTALITGAQWEGESAIYVMDTAGPHILPYAPIPGSFSGAGDVFTALFTGHILSGQMPADAARAALQTTRTWLLGSLRDSHGSVGLPVERYF